MAEKRDSKRVSCMKPVMYGPATSPPKFKGYLIDLSVHGVFIKTNNVFKPGTKLVIVIQDGDEYHSVEGVVMSAKKVPPAFTRMVKVGMGIRLDKPHPALLNIYRDKINA